MIVAYLMIAFACGLVAGGASLATGGLWWQALLIGYAGATAGFVLGALVRLAALPPRTTGCQPARLPNGMKNDASPRFEGKSAGQ